MQNISNRYEQVVREAIVKEAAAHGIDKNEFGYVIGGFGAIGLVIDNEGRQGMQPRWVLTLTLRHKLIGYPPKAGNLAVSGALPADQDFRDAIKLMVDGLDELREAEFNGQATS